MMQWGLRGLIMAVLMGSMAAAYGEVTVNTVTYRGWSGTYQMTNGTVELVFVPQIGRIMRYGYVGGDNVLWNNPAVVGVTPDPANLGTDWVNYGGDKLWNAPQSRWNWPPDPTLDRGPHTVKVLPNQHLLITGSKSPRYGLTFQREIALDATGTGVTLKNTLLNSNAKPVEWSVWEVTQMDDPTEMRLLSNKSGKFPAGYHVFGENAPAPDVLQTTESHVVLKRDSTKSAKIGGDAPAGVLEATVHGMKFHSSLKVEPGQTYPDDGCSQEIYTNPDPLPYVELELLSPLHTLKPGGKAALTTRWTLTK